MNRPRIYVTPVGEPDWNRFVIRRGKHRYWDGTGWTHDARDALLYHEEQDAISQAMVMNDSMPPRRFVTTCLIVVDHEPFTVKDLQKVLEQSVVSVVVPDQHEHLDIDINLDLRGLEEIQ